MPLGPAFKNKPVGGSQITLPSDGTDKVFARFVALIRSYTPLHGCTIRAWDDPTVDQSPPSEDGPPWVRLTPSPGPSQIYCRMPAGVCHRMPLTIEIETASQGLDVGNSQRLWGSILSAIFPGKIMDAQLQMLGVSRIAITKPAWAAPMDGSPRCYARGSVELLLAFITQE